MRSVPKVNKPESHENYTSKSVLQTLRKCYEKVVLSIVKKFDYHYYYHCYHFYSMTLTLSLRHKQGQKTIVVT